MKCESCGKSYEIKQGIPILLNDHVQTDLMKQKEIEHYNHVCDELDLNEISRFVSFLNYGYVENDNIQYSDIEIGITVLNRKHIKLLLEAIGKVSINGKSGLDVGGGRGGNLKLLLEMRNVYHLRRNVLMFYLILNHRIIILIERFFIKKYTKF